MINVTKPYLPPIEEYKKYIDGIWKRNWITNHGPLVNELEKELKNYLGVSNLQFLVNGTIPLQIAIKVLDIKGEIITTPFSYVATTGAILWENCVPVFTDIESETFCIDAGKIEAQITKDTQAILATHVYGFPCDVLEINKIAEKHNLRVIYDGAHAFGVKIYGKSIFEFGDISTCSFHATKLFHTVEGGAIFCRDNELNQKVSLYKSFGHIGDEYFTFGINGKNSEFHAAMGLCNLPRINDFIAQRKKMAELYKSEMLGLAINFPVIPDGVEYNFSYFPILFESEGDLLMAKGFLEKSGINSRRYFHPSLNKLPYIKAGAACPVSENISGRVLCLPFYQELSDREVKFISERVKKVFGK